MSLVDQITSNVHPEYIEPKITEAVTDSIVSENVSSEPVIPHDEVYVEEPAIEEEPVIAPQAQEEKSSKYVRPAQGVTIDETVFVQKEHVKGKDTLSLPSDLDSAVSKTMQDIPEINLTDSPDARQWAGVLSDGMNMSTFNETYVPTLEEKGRDFKQGLDFGGKRFSAARPRFKNTESEKLTGERAVLRMMTHLGTGSLFQVPLWHSGFWLTIKAPVDSEIVELNRLMTADKIEMGRQTYGLAFSNQSSYTTDRLVQFVLDHIYDSTLKRDQIPQDGGYKSIIAAQDYPSLLWSIVCSRYPDGFQYSRSCVSNPDKCNHVVNELINVHKLQWVDNASLTAWQQAHMSNRQSSKMDLASVKRYQEELTRTQNKTIKFKEGTESEFSMTLRSPTISEYVQSGHRWISDIVALVERTVGMEAREVERESFITKHCQATAMRQYQHWVKEIEHGDNSYDDQETIEKLLDSLSTDDEVREAFIQEVIDYINQSTISVIGIPVFDCPKCGGTQEEKSSPKNALIPLDVNQVFFGLVSQQLAKIESR